jgi:hypothetical protein
MYTGDSSARSGSILAAVHYIVLSFAYTSDTQAVIYLSVTCCYFFFGHVGRPCQRSDVSVQVWRGGGEQACIQRQP